MASDFILAIVLMVGGLVLIIYVLRYIQNVHKSGDESQIRKVITYGYLAAISPLVIAPLGELWLPGYGVAGIIGLVGLSIGFYHVYVPGSFGHGCLVCLLSLVVPALAILIGIYLF